MVKTRKKRPYKSATRERQADDTRRRIVAATRELLESEGYDRMTIEAIAQRAEVSAPSVYAIFKSKAGILAELLDQSSFGGDYESLVQKALNTDDPQARLRLAASIARQVHDAQSATLDLLRGAGVVAPELAKLEQRRERLRYEKQEGMIRFLHDGDYLSPQLDYGSARDVLWVLTGREIYRMLVRERAWPPQQYQNWLADALVRLLMASKTRSRQPRYSR
jgi:AcrR family transcriptional regulator